MRKMCINGHIVDESQGVIMLKSPSVRYGITLFEAMNVEYNNEKQYVIFRLHDHIRRLMYGCKVLNLDLPRTFNEIINDSVNLIKVNDLKRSIGLRIFVYYDHEGSITMSQKATVAMYLLDLESMRKDSINVMISDYHKSENGMLPVQVKSPAHYVYTRMALQKAYDAGFDDCIFMNTNGFITECSRASIFIIKNNMILTPSLSSTVLDSITRRSCITLAQELSIPVYEMPLTRDNVFSADAAFSAGSSLGLTEINRVDSIMLETSNNKVYKQIKEKYMNCVLGREHHEWITTI